jgi:hypothetical protein
MLEPEVEIGTKLHVEEPGFETVSMRWFFANSEKAMHIFRDVLDGCSLRQTREIFGTCPDLVRVVQANIIEIRGRYPVGRWHSDFTDKQLGAGECATLLTPLFSFKPHFGGLETTRAKRGVSDDYDGQSEVYRYRDGEAVLFDGSAMIHRTQSYEAEESERRVLVSWQLADTRPALLPILSSVGKRNGDPMFFSTH